MILSELRTNVQPKTGQDEGAVAEKADLVEAAVTDASAECSRSIYIAGG